MDKWDPKERGIVAMYLVRGRSAPWHYMGFDPSGPAAATMERGSTWTTSSSWPEGLAHYVMDHSVRLPEEIIEHIKRRVANDMSLD